LRSGSRPFITARVGGRYLPRAIPVSGRRRTLPNRDRTNPSLSHHVIPSCCSQERTTYPPVRPLVIGIAGGTGSGKSTVARKVAAALPEASVAFIEMDAYYRNFSHLSLEERRNINWDHPETFDVALLVEHLDRLARGEAIERPVYDFVSHTRSDRTVPVPATDVVVVDGIMLFADERLRSICEIKVYVDTDADIRLLRRVRRDMIERGRPLDEILDQYLTTVRPMHLQFVEPSKRYADIIVPRGGHNEVAIEMITGRIQRRLEAHRV
jgi:uridine kinase